jgi:hypothetical protein
MSADAPGGRFPRRLPPRALVFCCLMRNCSSHTSLNAIFTGSSRIKCQNHPAEHIQFVLLECDLATQNLRMTLENRHEQNVFDASLPDAMLLGHDFFGIAARI